jgi:hypothetical protein
MPAVSDFRRTAPQDEFATRSVADIRRAAAVFRAPNSANREC